LINPQKRSGAKKPTPTAGLSSFKNSGRGKKLFTAPSSLQIRKAAFLKAAFAY
jgi:hypothetical protein